MATYLMLGNFTDQGIRNATETTGRVDAFRGMASELGVKVKEVFWTMGSFDICCLLDAPDEQTLTALTLKVGMLGNVRTQTLRAFDAGEMSGILDTLRG